MNRDMSQAEACSFPWRSSGRLCFLAVSPAHYCSERVREPDRPREPPSRAATPRAQHTQSGRALYSQTHTRVHEKGEDGEEGRKKRKKKKIL